MESLSKSLNVPTPEIQRTANNLIQAAFRACILKMIAVDHIEHGRQIPDKDTLAYMVERIAGIKGLTTRKLRGLFHYAQEYRRKNRLLPAPATIADLRQTYAIYEEQFRELSKPQWVPARDDNELRELPQCRALREFYKSQGKYITFRRIDENTPALGVVKNVAIGLKRI